MGTLYKLKHDSELVLAPRERGWWLARAREFGSPFGAAWIAPEFEWSDFRSRPIPNIRTFPDLAAAYPRFFIWSSRARETLLPVAPDCFEALALRVAVGAADYTGYNCIARVPADRLDRSGTRFEKRIGGADQYFEFLSIGADAVPDAFFVEDWHWNGTYFTERFAQAVQRASLTGFAFVEAGRFG